MDRTENKSDTPRFQVGDKVRVKLRRDRSQIFPTSLWVAGRGPSQRSSKHDDQITYVIKWDERTLASYPPALPQAV